MPFTFSHPAAVVPLARKPWLIFSALIIGSMAPDFESFLNLSTDVTFAHSLPGIAIFCLPAGILIFLLFHLLLKRPLMSLVPEAHQQRLLPLACDIRLTSLRQWAIISLSLTLGAMTHLLWDAATHRYGWIVQKVTLLQATVLPMGAKPLKMYTLLQHGGTLIGGIILVYYYWSWYKAATPAESADDMPNFSEKQKLGIASAIICGGGSVGVLYATIRSATEQHGAHFLKDTVLMGIPCILLGAIVFSSYAIFIAAKAPKTCTDESAQKRRSAIK